jgi:integrase
VKPSTIGIDLSLIHTVLEAAKEANIVSIDLEVVDEARRRCRRDGLIGNSDKSGRRITEKELKDLDRYFAREDGRRELPMADLMWFALYSTRRVSEICRLEWKDNDSDERTGLVRDALHPHEPTARHKKFKMTHEAWSIVNRQQRMNEYIFAYKARSIGIAFARACLALDIADVTFDNLRREGMIRLFERGLTLAQVREHSLCDTLGTLQRCQAAARPKSYIICRTKPTFP